LIPKARISQRIINFLTSLDLKCRIFLITTLLAYASQSLLKREDWPLTKLSLFTAGRYDTTQLVKVSLQYQDTQRSIDPLLLGSDKFFIIESLSAIIQNKEEDLETKKSKVELFLKENVLPILTRHFRAPSGVLILRVRSWNELRYDNYFTPNEDYIFLEMKL